MREKTKMMIKKVHDLLLQNEYITSYDLAKKCHLHPWSIRRIIKHLRIQGIGIITTNKGYILAEYAKQSDDVTFVRRIMGRRASDTICIQAARRHIQKRWKSVEGKNNINNVLNFLSPINGVTKVETSLKYLLTYVNSKGS
jgi:biotin operon repressor